MQYKVNQFARGTTLPCGEFNNINDARLFIKAKLQEDAAFKRTIIYRIEEFGDTIEEIDPSKISAADIGSAGSTGSAGKGSSASFRPTPFTTAPKPAGVPSSFRRDEEDKKDKK